jgi:hypothetical protein
MGPQHIRDEILTWTRKKTAHSTAIELYSCTTRAPHSARRDPERTPDVSYNGVWEAVHSARIRQLVS